MQRVTEASVQVDGQQVGKIGPGLLVLLGIATELGALLIVPVMLVAVLKVHFGNGYFLPSGAEYSLNLLLICIALILGGPGKQALWDPMARWRSGH